MPIKCLIQGTVKETKRSKEINWDKKKIAGIGNKEREHEGGSLNDVKE